VGVQRNFHPMDVYLLYSHLCSNLGWHRRPLLMLLDRSFHYTSVLGPTKPFPDHCECALPKEGSCVEPTTDSDWEIGQ